MRCTPAAALILLVLGAAPLPAQEPEATPAPEATPPPEPAPSEAAPGETPPPAEVPEGPEGEEEPRPKPPSERYLPRLDVYFPEGDLDLRVNRLINKVFFEGQVKYNFIKGDISAFLRYRYYGFQRITQFTVFDAIEFDDVEDFSSDFDRVRGTLLLLQWPHSYHQRTFVLAELDRISTNKEDVAQILRLGRTNTFLRLGYQLGTPEDARSNAIVGETRARSERLFTAFREIGPGGFGFTGALTSGFDIGFGDFDYLKLETELLKRFDVSDRTFLVGRLHAGSFLRKGLRDREDLPDDFNEFDELSIPLGEYFRLDGRENLKGISEKLRGTDEIHTTLEYFFPWFLGADHKFLKLNWQNWYWILYGGVGNIGLDTDIYTDFGAYVPDAGIGFESSFNLRKYRFFLSGIVAQALKGEGGVEARVSVKSYR
ncbi:MAG TPA: hypothetical protein VNM67_15980 [Thermoanaerobaculia bacterium]|jgi:hypothetical protein|nr:hypothetical protein [Thermoanaerobaculia bacterium]